METPGLPPLMTEMREGRGQGGGGGGGGEGGARVISRVNLLLVNKNPALQIFFSESN